MGAGKGARPWKHRASRRCSQTKLADAIDLVNAWLRPVTAPRSALLERWQLRKTWAGIRRQRRHGRITTVVARTVAGARLAGSRRPTESDSSVDSPPYGHHILSSCRTGAKVPSLWSGRAQKCFWSVQDLRARAMCSPIVSRAVTGSRSEVLEASLWPALSELQIGGATRMTAEDPDPKPGTRSGLSRDRAPTSALRRMMVARRERCVYRRPAAIFSTNSTIERRILPSLSWP
jgi:hypothetical protein